MNASGSRDHPESPARRPFDPTAKYGSESARICYSSKWFT